MDTPLDLQFKNFQGKKGEITKLVQQRTKRLEKFNNHIVSCHVFIEQLKNIQHSHHSYYVRVDVNIPHHEVVVKREPEKGKIDTAPLPKILRDIFGTVERQLKQITDKQRGKVKAHTLEKTVPDIEQEEDEESED